MRRLIAVTALILGTAVPAVADPMMKFPNAFQKRYYERYCMFKQPYFECDYTSNTCMRGHVNHDGFIGEILAEDRKTVLKHVECFGYMCTDFDSGEVTYKGEVMTNQRLTKDATEDEVARLRAERC